MNSIIKNYAFLLICVFAWTSCSKDVANPIDNDGNIHSDKLEQNIEDGAKAPCCPETTVPYTDLANYNCDDNLQLGKVWYGCYKKCKTDHCPGVSHISQYIGQVYGYIPTMVLQQTGNNMQNWPNVNYAEQRALIDYVLDKASLQAPSCPIGGTMSVLDIEFCRDGTITTGGINANITYWCCEYQNS